MNSPTSCPPRAGERDVMRRPTFFFLLAFAVVLASAGCAGHHDPLDTLRQDLAPYAQYSVILEDMRVEGNFLPDHEHRYKVVLAEKGGEEPTFRDRDTGWVEVSDEVYDRYRQCLGMTVLAKSEEGKVTRDCYPPGYRYVGNSRYGRWRTDSRGGSFWEFYGKYALMRTMFDMGTGSIHRRDWDGYRDARTTGRPFFGNERQYGTGGSHTQKTHPTFYERQKARQAAKKSRFSDKVSKRVNRSRGSSSRRGSRGGK